MRFLGHPRAGAGSALIAGLGFGIPCLVAIPHLAATGDVWRFLGFPTYGDGPFERAGIPTTVPLLVGFLAVCIAEVGLAVLILRGSPRARALSALLLPIELIYWVGFALPFGPLLGLARVAHLWVGRPGQDHLDRSLPHVSDLSG